jgi:hypothetical protein
MKVQKKVGRQKKKNKLTQTQQKLQPAQQQ